MAVVGDVVAKVKLSGSTSGKGIKLANTSTTIHTAVAGAVNYDEIWIWVLNTHTAAVVCTIEFGGTTDPDNVIEKTIPADDGLFLMVPGLILDGGLVVGGKGGTTNVLVAYGYVHNLTAS